MISPGGTRIVVATRAVDFRKGHDGLAAVVQNELGLDPYSGVAYVFRAKRARPDQGAVVRRHGPGAGVQAPGGRAVCLAGGAQRRHPAHPGAVRGVVRGTGLAPGVVPEGTPSAHRGLTPEAAAQA